MCMGDLIELKMQLRAVSGSGANTYSCKDIGIPKKKSRAVKWSMRDRTNDLEIRRASPWDKFRGFSASARHQYKRGREDRLENAHRLVLAERCVPASVRVSSSAPSESRQRRAIVTEIPKALKISTKYVDNSVENSKPMKSDPCTALASLIFAQNLGNYLHD